jgi:hypothetical protein
MAEGTRGMGAEEEPKEANREDKPSSKEVRHPSRGAEDNSREVEASNKGAGVNSRGPRKGSKEEMAEVEVEVDAEDGARETRSLC